MSLFQRRDIDEYTDSLAAYLPGGSLFASKSIQDSNFRKLLRGLAGELFRANGYLREYDILPDKTELFLSEWESTLGIPDDCFSGEGTIEERRRDVLFKLAALGVQTAEDFVELAATFGYVVEVSSLSELGVPPYDVPFIPVGYPESRFIMVVKGVNILGGVPPYDVPFFLFVGQNIIQCLFEKLKPANCDIIFLNVN